MNYAAQNSDNRFPYVLVISTLGTMISLREAAAIALQPDMRVGFPG